MRYLRYLWFFLKQWFKRQPIPLRAIRVEAVPDKAKSGLVYIVGEENPWFVVMTCPCGCRSKIHMSLLPGDYPVWQLKEHNNCTITLTPSVWRTKGCRSHFFLRKGLVDWCR